jgi:TATA-box binding protein (TBP) (component of TFIID and TFIIIB)
MDAYEGLIGTPFEVRYEPERPPICLFIKAGRMTFLVFSNGSVSIPGSFTIEKEQEVLTSLWKQHLEPHIVVMEE